jgi:hypothetical protein
VRSHSSTVSLSRSSFLIITIFVDHVEKADRDEKEGEDSRMVQGLRLKRSVLSDRYPQELLCCKGGEVNG